MNSSVQPVPGRLIEMGSPAARLFFARPSGYHPNLNWVSTTVPPLSTAMPGTSTPDQSKSGAKYGASQVLPLSHERLIRLRKSGSLGGCILGSRRRVCVKADTHPPSASCAIEAWEMYAKSSLCRMIVPSTL